MNVIKISNGCNHPLWLSGLRHCLFLVFLPCWGLNLDCCIRKHTCYRMSYPCSRKSDSNKIKSFTFVKHYGPGLMGGGGWLGGWFNGRKSYYKNGWVVTAVKNERKMKKCNRLYKKSLSRNILKYANARNSYTNCFCPHFQKSN